MTLNLFAGHTQTESELIPDLIRFGCLLKSALVLQIWHL